MKQSILQDMPPPGGFETINIERVPPKAWIKQGWYLAILIGLSINGAFVLREWKKRQMAFRIETMEHYIASSPFMEAERERNFLRHLWQIREEERELMKDYPNWTVGTLFGEKLFKTLPPGALPPIHEGEFVAHRPQKEYLVRNLIPDWHL